MDFTYSPVTSDSSQTPSKVIHFRNVTDRVSQNDILALTEPHGKIAKIVMLKVSKQAMVQYENISSAISFIKSLGGMVPTIRSTQVFPQYSEHHDLDTSSTVSTQPPSPVLLVSIMNVNYSVDVNVLCQVFSRYETSPRGTPEKIVIFRKSGGLQALVQMSSIQCATNAMRGLDGKDIYARSCTLRIQYSSQTDLNIVENTQNAWDYTTGQRPPTQFPLAPLSAPTHISFSSVGAQKRFTPSAPPSAFAGLSAGSMRPQRNAMMGRGGGGDRAGCIVLVSNFNPSRCTSDKLFNLFTQYGFVEIVKMHHSADNKAFIQYSRPEMAEKAVECLDEVYFFGCATAVQLSTHDHLDPPRSIAEGGDGKTTDYRRSSLNRYSDDGTLNLRNCVEPTSIVHVSNLSPTTNETALITHLGQSAVAQAVKMFGSGTKFMALVQFDNEYTAAEMICDYHNTMLQGQTIRLTFSNSSL